MAAHIAVELVGHAHNDGQQHQVEHHAQQGVFDLQGGENHNGEENRNHNHHKEKAGAAAGMVAGLLFYVLHGELQAVFIAVDGLVLRPVVGEHPAHLLGVGAQPQITQENGHLHHTFHHRLDPQRHLGPHQADEAGESGGQQDEQAHREGNSQGRRYGDEDGGGLLLGEVGVQPLLQPAGLLVLLLLQPLLGHLGGVHQGLDSVNHGRAEDEHPSHQGQLGKAAAGLNLLGGDIQLPVGLAHHDGPLLRALHHNALNEGLTTAGGLIRRPTGGRRLIGHGIELLYLGRTPPRPSTEHLSRWREK